ncbi:hypothetical protein SASPL_152098 [Salvia splendens]|uniref:DUF7906 domain-containing protein n=1 Tax=Salvia splendens TaxID=180675 RepID=A0A8X8W2M6_SALSN|nr:hypothetical protein SASPL_152098 [Salvia splendens]
MQNKTLQTKILQSLIYTLNNLLRKSKAFCDQASLWEVFEYDLSKSIAVFGRKKKNLNPVTKKDLESGNLDGFHAECLTDTWIGNQRWVVFIDLSAGPFSWGPSEVEKECVQSKAYQMWRKQLVQLQVIVGQRK